MDTLATALDARGITVLDLVIAGGALTTFAARNIEAARAGKPFNAFWSCDFATLLVAVAILGGAPNLSAACFIVLLPGIIIWFMDLFVTGGEWRTAGRVTGFLMHAWALGAATYAVHRNGYAPRGWAAALSLQVGLYLFSRYALPAKANINAVWKPPLGWLYGLGSMARFRVAYVTFPFTFALIGQALSYYIANWK